MNDRRAARLRAENQARHDRASGARETVDDRKRRLARERKRRERERRKLSLRRVQGFDIERETLKRLELTGHLYRSEIDDDQKLARAIADLLRAL